MAQAEDVDLVALVRRAGCSPCAVQARERYVDVDLGAEAPKVERLAGSIGGAPVGCHRAESPPGSGRVLPSGGRCHAARMTPSRC
jgi:hypothetical protein